MLNRLLQTVFALLSLSFSSYLFAGELLLENGDRLGGELESLNGSSLEWNSSSFGVLQVDIADILTMNSSTVLESLEYAGGNLNNCQIGIAEGQLLTSCENSQNLALSTSGQLPTIPAEIEIAEETPSNSGEIKAAFSKRAGNTDNSSLDISANSIWEGDVAKQTLTLDADREENNDITTKDNYSLDYQADFPAVGNWIYFGRAGYEEDKFASVEKRYELGGGIGYRPMIAENITLDTNLGLDYVVNELQDGSETKGAAARWGLNSEWAPDFFNLTLFHNHSYSVLLKDADQYQIETSTGVKIPLMDSLFAELRYDYDYDGAPLPGTNASDSEWVFSLGYGW